MKAENINIAKSISDAIKDVLRKIIYCEWELNRVSDYTINEIQFTITKKKKKGFKK